MSPTVDASALAAACDPSRPAGRRDRAVLLLLGRHGLRACEVTRLERDDLDWRAGELRVRGKGGGEARLPLPSDVAEAIATYLRDGRRRTESRAVFVRLLAPTGPLTSCGVWNIVARAAERAGQGRVGPTGCATPWLDLLARGAALPEIAQVLGHREPGHHRGVRQGRPRRPQRCRTARPGAGR